MLLLNINKHKIAMAIPLILMLICLTVDIASSKEENSSDLFRVFSDLIESTSTENKAILIGWNDYLTKGFGYSNAEHLKVIEELTMDYAKAVKALDYKNEKDRELDKIKYTSKWLDGVVERFGREFVCNNNSTVLMNLMILFDRTHAKRYDQDAKEIISKELALYLAYDSYLSHFVEYYNQSNKNDQEKMSALKVVAERYLSITNRSHFAELYFGRHFNNKMSENATQKENKELYMYFKKVILPFGSAAQIKARRDMDIFVEKCKMQSSRQPGAN